MTTQQIIKVGAVTTGQPRRLRHAAACFLQRSI